MTTPEDDVKGWLDRARWNLRVIEGGIEGADPVEPCIDPDVALALVAAVRASLRRQRLNDAVRNLRVIEVISAEMIELSEQCAEAKEAERAAYARFTDEEPGA